jgi:integrase
MGRYNRKVRYIIKADSRSSERNEELTARARKLATAPDTPSKAYGATVARFERLAQQFGWLNKDGSLYPVSRNVLHKYIAFHEKQVKPQSIMSYLSALKEKHEQLGFLEWKDVRFHNSTLRILKNIKRNHVHMAAKQSKPITIQQLAILKSRLTLSNPRHSLFWAVATVAFHAMARLGEMLPADDTRAQWSVRLAHLTLGNGENGPYATITLPRSKTHDPNIKATLAIWADGSDTCPWAAIKAYLKLRLDTRYASDSDALWCIENGKAISKRWFLEALAQYLPEYEVTGHSFRAGGATHLALRGYPKWIIQRLGRWTSDAFEVYIRTKPELLIAFAQALDGKRAGNPRSRLEGWNSDRDRSESRGEHSFPLHVQQPRESRDRVIPA